MRRAQLRRRRSRAQLAILSAIAVLSLVIGGVAAGLGGYLGAATDAGARTTLEDAAPKDAALQVSARLVVEPDDQDAAVADGLARLLPGVPYDLHRSLVTEPRTLFAEAGDPEADGFGRAALASYDGLAERAELVEGAWPDEGVAAGVVQAAVHTGPAEDLGFGVGDTVQFEERDEIVTVEITGSWRPADPGAAYWFGEAREVEGADERIAALIVVAEADLVRLPGGAPQARWRLVPDLGELAATDLATLRFGLQRVRGVLSADDRLADSGLAISGGLLDILREGDERLRAAASVAVAPLTLFGAVGVLALVLAAGLLATLRVPETALLRGRGTSRTQLTWWSLREALLVIAFPAALGGVAAWALLRAGTSVANELSVLVFVWGVTATVVLGVATMTVVGARAARGPMQATVAQLASSGRRRIVLPASFGVVVLAAAVLAIWQLRRYGAPAVPDAAGVLRTDPLAVAAPATALLAGAVLVAAAVAATAWFAQRLLGRRRGLAGVLGARQVARRPAAYVVPVMLIVLAAGGGTLAAGFTGTWTDLQRETAAQRTGADLKVLTGEAARSVREDSHEVSLEPYRDLPGITSATPVVSGTARVSDGEVELLVSSDASADASLPGIGPLPGVEPLSGVELPAGAESVEFVFDARVLAEENELALDAFEVTDLPAPGPAGVTAHAWVADADSLLALVSVDRMDVPSDGEWASYTIRADLPDGSGPWTLVGLELGLAAPSAAGPPELWAVDYDIDLSAVHVDPGGAEVQLNGQDGWTVTPVGTQQEGTTSINAAPSGIGLRVAHEENNLVIGAQPQVSVRLTPGVAPSERLPVIASVVALDRFGLVVGDQAALRVFGTTLDVEVVGQLDSVPGTTAGNVMVADLAMLNAMLLQSGQRIPVANQIWLDADPSAADSETLRRGVAGIAGAQAEVIDRVSVEEELLGNVFARLNMVTFWVVTGAALLLTAAGAAAGAAVLVRQRRGEVEVLRALGLSPGQQAWSRSGELAFVALLAVGLGAVAGLVVSVLTVGLLADAAAPSALENLDPVLRFEAVPWAAYLIGLIAAVLVVALRHGARVRTQASSPPNMGRWAG